MYTPQEVLSGVRDPRKAFLELNRIYHRKIRGQTGIKVMEEDWDNLIILDACRYDLFEEVNTINGKLEPVISGDSSTSGFLSHNFSSYYPDTVYIAANPQVQRHGVGKKFYDCLRLWEDHWNDKLRTVLPEDVTKCAIDASESYPHKRLIIHYIQPHYPFIGETGMKMNHGTITGDGVMTRKQKYASVWDQLAAGEVNSSRVWKAYKENLELTVPEIEQLIKNINGKSIITSDHGNAFNEFGISGHPGGVFLNSLVKVPWLTIDHKQRRKVEEGVISNEKESMEGDVADRLADLGYLE